jgi:hypothetical protein
MAGGHPRTATCRQDGLWDCWESVPIEGVFDTCIRKADAASSWWLPLAPATPPVGDQVFVVGRPGFSWPTAELAQQYQVPLVSAGKVIDVQGRALIMSAAAFSGDSGHRSSTRIAARLLLDLDPDRRPDPRCGGLGAGDPGGVMKRPSEWGDASTGTRAFRR